MSNIVINDLEMNQELDQHAAAKITGSGIRGWLVRGAYKLGKVVGKKLDKKYDLSDKASDAAINTFGTAPRWLQNWF